MIQIIKTPKPAILRVKSLKWTIDVLAYLKKGQKAPELLLRKYNHAEVKKALKIETYKKCAYCESKVSHVYPGDIEHILPKSKFPDLMFDWNNLTFACSICNNNKSDYYNSNFSIINPYTDNISEHLTCWGPLIIHMPGSRRGEITHRELELNRGDLYERRAEALKNFKAYLDSYAKEDEPNTKGYIKKEIINMMQQDKEFSFVINNAFQEFLSKGFVF